MAGHPIAGRRADGGREADGLPDPSRGGCRRPAIDQLRNARKTATTIESVCPFHHFSIREIIRIVLSVSGERESSSFALGFFSREHSFPVFEYLSRGAPYDPTTDMSRYPDHSPATTKVPASADESCRRCAVGAGRIRCRCRSGLGETALCLSTDELRLRAIDRLDTGATERASASGLPSSRVETVDDERRVRESAPEKCSLRIASFAHLL